MARTAAPPKEVKTAKEVKVNPPTPPLPVIPEVKEEGHIWEKVTGKYHTKDHMIITPGQTFIAGKDTFTNDPAWKYIGPVE